MINDEIIATELPPLIGQQGNYPLQRLGIVSEYDQEIQQSQTADNPMAP